MVSTARRATGWLAGDGSPRKKETEERTAACLKPMARGRRRTAGGCGDATHDGGRIPLNFRATDDAASSPARLFVSHAPFRHF